MQCYSSPCHGFPTGQCISAVGYKSMRKILYEEDALTTQVVHDRPTLISFSHKVGKENPKYFHSAMKAREYNRTQQNTKQQNTKASNLLVFSGNA